MSDSIIKTKSEQLEEFLLQNIEFLQRDGGSGSNPDLPDFDLYAFDYLEFAEKRLNNIEALNDKEELINCVAHLKRAVDCQLDTFFYSCNLSKVVSKQNLRFSTKLEFLKDIGVFSSRSLKRLNSLRNRMEHEYEVPQIGDIEVYYDLVSAFITVIQGLIFLLSYNTEIDFSIYSDNNEDGYYSSKFNKDKNEIDVTWFFRKADVKNNIIVKVDDRANFRYFFRMHLLLTQLETFASWEHLRNKLKIPSLVGINSNKD